MRSHRLVSLSAVLMLALAGPLACSGDQKEAEEPAQGKAKKGEEEPDEPAADAPAKAEEDDGEEDAPVDAAPLDPAPAPAPVPEPTTTAEPEGFTAAPVTRFVTSFALKVRSQPSPDGAVVGWVKWGDKVDVVINGEWAKLANGRYISINRLSETAPVKKGAKGKPAVAPGGAPGPATKGVPPPPKAAKPAPKAAPKAAAKPAPKAAAKPAAKPAPKAAAPAKAPPKKQP